MIKDFLAEGEIFETSIVTPSQLPEPRESAPRGMVTQPHWCDVTDITLSSCLHTLLVC